MDIQIESFETPIDGKDSKGDEDKGNGIQGIFSSYAFSPKEMLEIFEVGFNFNVFKIHT